MTLTRYMPRPGLMLAMLLAASVFMLVSAGTRTHSDLYAQETPAGGGSAAAPQGSPANGTPTTVDRDGKKIHCNEIPEAKGGVFLGKIIPCLAKTIETSSQRFSSEFINWLQPTIWAFITFVVVMFGLRILQGEGQLQSHGLVLLIKITLVMGILALIPDTFIPALYKIMTESQAVVMSTIGPEATSINCDISKYMDSNTPMIWAQMDCVVGKLYGFTTGAEVNGVKQPNMLLASSMVGLLGGFFFGGTLGAALFFACIGVLWTMFMLILRVVTAFINAYLIIALYMIISPLFLPLVFLKVTTSYFDKWTSGILAGVLMPVIVCAYVTMALQIYDKMLFADDSLVKNLFDNEWVSQAQELPRQACDRQFVNEPRFRSDVSGKSENDIYRNPFFQNFINPLLSGGNNICAGMKLPVFNMDATKNKAGFDTNKKKFEKLFRDCVKLFILAWLIDAGFKTVIGAIRPVLGSGALAATLDATSPEEKRLQAGMAGAKEGFTSAFRRGGGETGVSGAEFIGRLPESIVGREVEGRRQGGAVSGFMRGFTGKQD